MHRASRGDWLVAGLAELLRTPVGDDPFTAEVVAVPTRGVERWLTQTLSATLGTSPGRADGVCANVEFPFPGAMVSEATTAAVGIRPADDPWAPRRAVWPLLEVVDANLGEPWLAMLAAHIAGRGEDPEQARRARRFSAVRHLADLLDRYSVHRPAMVRSWSEGEETDGDGAALPEDLAWQARLWRQLRDRLGVASPAERMGRACELLRASPELADLPERLSLFGLTRLPSTYLDVLAALGVHRDVHLWLLHPSAALWDALAAGPAPGRLPRRREDSTADRAANPLLASWGRDAREMQLVLSAGGAVAGESIGDRNHPDTLLGRIQADIRANQDPPATAFPTSREARPVLAETDRSLQVHSCHGQARQVEVLRDAILHLLAGDPTLEPRDVIVMCPDIDAFAPLIHATFGPGREVAGGRSLHVRLADRSIRQTNPVFAALSQLLALAAGRVSASEILDFAASAPVRRRFRLDDDDLARVGHWVRQAGVRWGLDATGRGRYQLQRVEAGTWRSGLDRILLGVAMAEDDLRLFGGVLPLDDVDSSDVELAGVLAELVERVGTTVASFATPSTLSEWVARILAATDTLMDVAGADEWQRRQLGSALEEVLSEGSAAPDALLALTEVRALLTDRLRGQPTRANFRTGHLTMCTLVPMRSVPHRVVCLLGLDDGEFPRRTAVDGDDILERDPHVGDREARSEDRQLLLDALLAAGDHLVITYCGRDLRTNAPRPPAVPVGELLDVVDRTVITAEGRPARQQVVVHHPLQSWDPRNFTPGALAAGELAAGELAAGDSWSFDEVSLAGATALTGERTQGVLTAAGWLSPRVVDPLQLEDLIRFVQHPVREFLRQRLGVAVRGDWPEPGDTIPIDLDNLQTWQVGERLLRARLDGATEEACRAAELSRGEVPPGALGGRLLDKVFPVVAALVSAAGDGEASSVDVSVDLGGRSIAGTVGNLFGHELRTVTYSRLAPSHRLAAWVRYLALTAAFPERAWVARTVGRGRSDTRPATASVGLLSEDPDERRCAALGELSTLVDLHERGMREPLPMPCRASHAWAQATFGAGDPAALAAGAWNGDAFDGERSDSAHQMVFGKDIAFEALLAATPATDEDGPGWDTAEPTRFGRLAIRLWHGLLSAEQVT